VPSFDTLRRICREAVTAGVTPGLVVLIGRGGRDVFSEAFGQRQVEPFPVVASPETVYDLASLTKALVTSLLAMQAVASGRLDLEEPAPGTAGAAGATVRHLLAHAAGLPAHRPFYLQQPGRAGLVALAAAEPLLHPPGSRSLYSDLGFILLGDLLERRLGARLGALAEAALFAPAGARTLLFPGPGPHPLLRGQPVAPTERCPVRGRLIVGEVHDLNAAAMEGEAGHAGLFGAAADVSALVHALCAAWRDSSPAGAAPLIPAEVLRAFWQPSGIPGSCWRLGWDGPAPHDSLAGEVISRSAVGHLAFTGCSLWLDPEQETFVLVLANRVHPTVRDDVRYRLLRPALNDAALSAAGYTARIS
jgi:CubicO group peptidase (beta-lactamase class C family)